MNRLLPTTYFGPNEACAFCGDPIVDRQMVVYDDILDNWYCDNDCRLLDIQSQPHLLKLIKEDPNNAD